MCGALRKNCLARCEGRKWTNGQGVREKRVPLITKVNSSLGKRKRKRKRNESRE